MQISELNYIINPKDSGIILSRDFAAAAMIRQPEIRLVHVQQDAHEVTMLLKQIERPDFFKTLPGWVEGKLVFNETPNDIDIDERPAFEALIDYHHLTVAKMKAAGLELDNIFPEMRVAFAGRRNSYAGSVWHTDGGNVLSLCVDGAGTQYLEGEVSPDNAAYINIMQGQEFPPHLRAVETKPGDILVMRGRNQRLSGKFNEPHHNACARAIYHSAGLSSRRTVLLYPFD